MCTMSMPLQPTSTCARPNSAARSNILAGSATALARQSVHSLMNGGMKRSRSCSTIASSWQTPASELVPEDEDLQQLHVEEARRELRKLIETRIQLQQESAHDSKQKTTSANISRVAAMLERLIFLNQDSDARNQSNSHWIDTYADPDRLNERLVKLLSVVATRRAAKKATKDRAFILKRVLGFEQYQRIIAVAEEVRQLRLNRVKMGCKKCSLNNMCLLPYDAQVNLPSVMPDPVKKLFFQTDLMHVLEHAPVHSFQKLDWDGMLRQAVIHIQEYREWAESQKHFVRNIAAVSEEDEEQEQHNRAIKRGRFALV